MQPVDRLAEAIAGSVRKRRVPMHDSQVVVGIDVDRRRIPYERVVLGGQLKRGVDSSIGSGKPNESRIEVEGWEREKEGAVDRQLRTLTVEVLYCGLPEGVAGAAVGCELERNEWRGGID